MNSMSSGVHECICVPHVPNLSPTYLCLVEVGLCKRCASNKKRARPNTSRDAGCLLKSRSSIRQPIYWLLALVDILLQCKKHHRAKPQPQCNATDHVFPTKRKPTHAHRPICTPGQLRRSPTPSTTVASRRVRSVLGGGSARTEPRELRSTHPL